MGQQCWNRPFGSLWMEHRLAVKSRRTTSIQFQYEREQAVKQAVLPQVRQSIGKKATPTKKEPQGYGIKVLLSWFKTSVSEFRLRLPQHLDCHNISVSFLICSLLGYTYRKLVQLCYTHMVLRSLQCEQRRGGFRVPQCLKTSSACAPTGREAPLLVHEGPQKKQTCTNTYKHCWKHWNGGLKNELPNDSHKPQHHKVNFHI